MRVVIFGASGGIGSDVRRQARDAGHELVLFGRDASKLEPLTPSESVRVGDIADAHSVAEAVRDADAVISAVGPTSNAATEVPLFESYAHALVAGMASAGVRRLVALSGAACTLPGERKTLRGRIASRFVRLAVGNVVEAKQRELDVIAASDLDWTAVRPPRVVESPTTGTFRVGEAATGMGVTQGDLAAFMVEQLSDDRYIRQAPYISN